MQSWGAYYSLVDFGINTTFIIYRIGETLIDAGPSNQWSTIKRVLKLLTIKTLLITHHHEDHSGNANRISKLKKLMPYAPLLGQDKLAKGYPSPGHTKDLTCLFLPEQKYLFSGDMYISKSLKYLRADDTPPRYC
jgi:glyoxylase-like metal-dependent hydrolase (beta-lactamase superfamily II)